jgi:cobaltochelatase CobS
MVMSHDELKGKLYELGTVEIRSVLRILNNTVRKTVEGAQLAAMKHEAAFRVILDEYNFDIHGDEVEAAFLKVTEAQPTRPPAHPYKPTPPREPVEHVEIPSQPSRPKTREEMLAELLSAPTLDISKVNELIHQHPDVANLLAAAESQGNINQSTLTTLDAYRNRIENVEEHATRLGLGIDELAASTLANLATLREEMKKSNALSLTITFPDDRPPVDLGLVHKDTAKLISYLAAGCNVFMPGPAGSGKSTAASLAAKALGLKFYATSVCQQTTETKFLGYMDAAGHYHPSEYRKAYEGGGLFLVDEIDAGNPNVLAVLNASLSNGWCAFADGMVEMHPKFRCVAAGNTWGTGRTIQYVGRNPIDAATLNRFVFISWEYDEALEAKITGLPDWSTYVQQCRAEIHRRGVNYLITPRASIFGAKLLRAGINVQDVINDVVLPNLDPDIKKYMPPAPVISI